MEDRTIIIIIVIVIVIIIIITIIIMIIMIIIIRKGQRAHREADQNKDDTPDCIAHY